MCRWELRKQTDTRYLIYPKDQKRSIPILHRGQHRPRTGTIVIIIIILIFINWMDFWLFRCCGIPNVKLDVFSCGFYGSGRCCPNKSFIHCPMGSMAVVAVELLLHWIAFELDWIGQCGGGVFGVQLMLSLIVYLKDEKS